MYKRQIEGYDTDGKKIKIRAREELAIAFQHEIDPVSYTHLICSFFNSVTFNSITTKQLYS